MKIYRLNVKEIEKQDAERWYNGMSDERKYSVNLMKSEHKKLLRIAADALCRKAVSEFCNVGYDEIVFETAEKGKPFAKGLPVQFSISHSGDYVVCAVSENEIGIDVEKIRSVHPRAAEKFATESEKKHILQKQNGFFEIWTLKEAYFKCIGTGLGADIKDVSFEVEKGEIVCSEKGFNFSFIEIDCGYVCSICEKIKKAP